MDVDSRCPEASRYVVHVLDGVAELLDFTPFMVSRPEVILCSSVSSYSSYDLLIISNLPSS